MKDRVEQDSIGLIVHAYNNFLGGMMGFTELALLDIDENDVNEKLELVLSSGKEAVVFGNQLLSLISRMQTQFENVDLLKILHEVSESNNIKIVNNIQFQSLTVSSNAQWLWFCLESLSIFAQEYSKSCNQDKGQNKGQPQNSGLIWQLKIIDQQLELSLSGNGLVFTKDQEDRLFEAFYSSRHLLGTKDVGIGFIKGFVKQMKGSMCWSNTESCFLLKLPLVETNSNERA